jgi:uncharacterized membrane protein YecN with MAPEG domain
MAVLPGVTLLYGSLAALLLAALGLNVSRARGPKKAGITTAPDAELLRVIRAHGNSAEWTPMLILMLLILELCGTDHAKLHALGAAIVLARLLHAAGVLLKNPVSVVGATLTYLLALAMPIYGLVLRFRA